MPKGSHGDGKLSGSCSSSSSAASQAQRGPLGPDTPLMGPEEQQAVVEKLRGIFAQVVKEPVAREMAKYQAAAL